MGFLIVFLFSSMSEKHAGRQIGCSKLPLDENVIQGVIHLTPCVPGIISRSVMPLTLKINKFLLETVRKSSEQENPSHSHAFESINYRV